MRATFRQLLTPQGYRSRLRHLRQERRLIWPFLEREQLTMHSKEVRMGQHGQLSPLERRLERLEKQLATQIWLGVLIAITVLLLVATVATP